MHLDDVTIAAGFRATLGEPREVEDEVFVPFVVTEVLKPQRLVAIEVEAPR